MSKVSQWIANSLFILSCLFLPWRDLRGPFGGHTASEGHFAGYHFLFTQPEGLALDGLLFMLQLILIGAILLWSETLIRSNLGEAKRKYIGATLALAIIVLLLPPLGETVLIPDSMGEIEDIMSGFGFLFTNFDAVAPKFIMIELIALFGLSTLAIKFYSKRIKPIPTNSIEEGDWNGEKTTFA